jgi:two-component sensor histidine kinase
VEFGLELEPAPSAPQRARGWLRRELGGVMSDEVLLDLQVIVSELVTNAVRHGAGEPIEVRVAVDSNESIRGEVEDHGTGEVEIRDRADGDGGFGLRLVESLAGRWGVYQDSTHVWFELRPARGRTNGSPADTSPHRSSLRLASMRGR